MLRSLFEPFASSVAAQEAALWRERPLIERFLHVAALYPDQAAIVDGDDSLTYAQLAGRIGAMSRQMAACTHPGDSVAIALPGTVSFIVAMLSCAAAGRPYVPMDISFPPERNRHILVHSRPAAIIGGTLAAELAPQLPRIEPPDAADEADCVALCNSSASILHILYTSGSTGEPKGVYQNQHNIIHDALRYAHTAGLVAGDGATLLYSPSVSGAMRDIYGALLNGATLHIMSLRLRGIRYVREQLAQGHIGIYHSIPPVLRALLRDLPADQVFPAVRLLYLSGDRLLRQDVELCRRHMPNACYYVGIGSTEVATVYTEGFLRPDTPLDHELMPVGYAVDDHVTTIIDDDGCETAQGAEGQLRISSPVMALGYWNAGSDLAQQFAADPERPGARRFDTGDLVREDADGLLHLIGRKDRQVKISGHRIELAQIESLLRRCDGVADAAVLVHRRGEQRDIVALVSPETVSLEQLRAACRQHLPVWMAPARYVRLEQLPVLGNFKPDLAALNQLAAAVELPEPPIAAVVPRSDIDALQLAVRKAWAEALNTELFDDDTSWYDLGGNSLSAIIMLEELERLLKRAIPPEGLVAAMTVNSLSRQLRSETKPAVVADRPVFLVPGIDGGVNLPFNTLSRELATEFPVVVLDNDDANARHAGSLQYDVLMARARATIDRHGEGPIHLVGYSYGVRIVFDLACQLAPARVASLTLMDLAPGGMPSQGPRPPRELVAALRRLPNLRHTWWQHMLRQLFEVGGADAVNPVWRLLRRYARRSPAELYLSNMIRLRTIRTEARQFYPGRVNLLRSRSIWPGYSDSLGWEQLCEGVDVFWIPDVEHEFLPSHPETLPTLRRILGAADGVLTVA